MMEWLWMGIFGGLALVFAGAALWFKWKKQRLYQEVDRMMDRGVSRKNWRLRWAAPRERRSR